ncbi:MAG: nitroreductase family protein [Clostridiaceae bacterium]|jgi:predicted oxidoreductase (fatty acid repression mutant protein)|nr:nitroreductase family protein [Clostridiaceae bacterium]
MSKDFYTIMKERRTFYGIGKESPVSDERIQQIIKDALKYSPSAFNSQGSRVVVLFGQQHNKLWDIAMETLRKIVPPASFAATEEKINSFRNGYGSVLFFEDVSVVESLQKQFPLYKDNFPVWAQQSNGMLQYAVWNSLQIEGLGSSLQHYNPLIDSEVKKQWNIADNWKLIAEMPFGKPTAEPDEKKYQPLDERYKVFK